MMIHNALVVTRHKALVEYLVNRGIVDAPSMTVIEHATMEVVAGRAVVGVLPLHLAAAAASLTVADLVIPGELRGKELSLDDVNRYVVDVTTYFVTTAPTTTTPTPTPALGSWMARLMGR